MMVWDGGQVDIKRTAGRFRISGVNNMPYRFHFLPMTMMATLTVLSCMEQDPANNAEVAGTTLDVDSHCSRTATATSGPSRELILQIPIAPLLQTSRSRHLPT